jgi:hypothetical protein
VIDVDDLGRRLERAVRARDQRLALAWVEANPPATCSGCGRPLETALPGTSGPGRTRVWCSNACRQRAYRARKATTAPDLPAEWSQPTSPTTHEADDCIVAVLDSPTAVASVLDVVRRALRDGVLGRPEYADVHVQLLALCDELDGYHQ